MRSSSFRTDCWIPSSAEAVCCSCRCVETNCSISSCSSRSRFAPDPSSSRKLSRSERCSATAESKLAELERRAMERAYTPDERAGSGVVIEILDDEITAVLGVIRPEGETAIPSAEDDLEEDTIAGTEDALAPSGEELEMEGGPLSCKAENEGPL